MLANGLNELAVQGGICGLVVAKNYDLLDTIFVSFVALYVLQTMLFLFDVARITVIGIIR